MTSFKALAEALGDGRAAKALYDVLRKSRPRGWHRVVRSNGGLPFQEAAEPLAREGIPLSQLAVDGFDELRFTDYRSRKPLEALRREQVSLASRLVLEDVLETPETVAGFDLSYQGTKAYVAAATVEWGSMQIVERVGLTTRTTFPYISTYLAYREFESIFQCYERLKRTPSLLLVDGNGILHPAGCGIACMVGLKLATPTIGVAKSLLLGKVDGELNPGETSPITHQGRLMGYALRPVRGKSIFISPGHLVSPSTALDMVRRLCRNRIPEPLRLAHIACSRMRREAS